MDSRSRGFPSRTASSHLMAPRASDRPGAPELPLVTAALLGRLEAAIEELQAVRAALLRPETEGR